MIHNKIFNCYNEFSIRRKTITLIRYGNDNKCSLQEISCSPMSLSQDYLSLYKQNSFTLAYHPLSHILLLFSNYYTWWLSFNTPQAHIVLSRKSCITERPPLTLVAQLLNQFNNLKHITYLP